MPLTPASAVVLAAAALVAGGGTVVAATGAASPAGHPATTTRATAPSAPPASAAGAPTDAPATSAPPSTASPEPSPTPSGTPTRAHRARRLVLPATLLGLPAAPEAQQRALLRSFQQPGVVLDGLQVHLYAQPPRAVSVIGFTAPEGASDGEQVAFLNLVEAALTRDSRTRTSQVHPVAPGPLGGQADCGLVDVHEPGVTLQGSFCATADDDVALLFVEYTRRTAEQDLRGVRQALER